MQGGQEGSQEGRDARVEYCTQGGAGQLTSARPGASQAKVTAQILFVAVSSVVKSTNVERVLPGERSDFGHLADWGRVRAVLLLTMRGCANR